ncbi:Nn.00g080330.m01.CDS01 [Neocucurbitaria sp. VM-36]
MASQDPFPNIVVGYPKLAAKIEIQPEVAILRRFGALGAQNLLYFQAELTDLERKVREQQVSDHNSTKGSKSSYAKNWFDLSDSENDGDTKQLELVMKIRETIKEYRTWDLHYLQDYLHAPEMGPLALTGGDSTIWGSKTDRKSHASDLIALRPRAKKDAFSMWAAENTIFNLLKCGCTRFMKPSRVHGVVGYEDSTIYRITYWITSVLASLIPIASIVVLYRVQSMPARLAIIAAFNVLVSICLMGFANAKRAEVFAITAA